MLRINARIQNIGSKNSTFLIFALKDNDIGPALKKANWLVRLYARHLYKQLNGSTQNANKRLKKILGDKVYTEVHKATPIILMPHPGYDQRFHFDGKNVFLHHGLKPYYLLTLHDYRIKSYGMRYLIFVNNSCRWRRSHQTGKIKPLRPSAPSRVCFYRP